MDRFSKDLVQEIFKRFDDHEDLLRSAAVSPAWYQLVTTGEFMKKLFMKKACIVYTDVSFEKEHEHACCGLLIRAMEWLKKSNLTIEEIQPSSTLVPNHTFPFSPSLLGVIPHQWSSNANDGPIGKETLVFKLPEISLVYALEINPFEDMDHQDYPIFKSKSACISFGYKGQVQFTETVEVPLNGNVTFNFSMPILVHEGMEIILHLFDYVDKHPQDDKYYIRLSRVKVKRISLNDTVRQIEDGKGIEAINYLDPKIKRDLKELDRVPSFLSCDGTGHGDVSWLAEFISQT